MPKTEVPLGKVVEVGFVVPDITRCVQSWEMLPGARSFTIYRSIEMTDVQINGAAGQVDLDVAMGCVGGVVVELISQNDDRPSPFLLPRGVTGPVFNHWSFFVVDFDDALARYLTRGYRVAFQAMFCGERRNEASRIAYLCEGSSSDGYIEIMEATLPLSTLYAKLLNESSPPASVYPGPDM